MANNEELQVIFSLNDKAFKRGLKKSERQLNSFNKSVSAIGGTIAAAFGTREVVRFGIEASRLAGKVDGVKKAFDKLDGANIENLRKSTAGAVADIELMQNANLAVKLGLDVRELGNLFAFASKTAQETGQSVQRLSSDIVRGIGRKSTLILDNLGISALQLRENLEGVSLEQATVAQVTQAVGKIAQKEMGGVATVIETTEIKTARLNASWQNLTNSFGQKAQGSYNIVLDFLADAIEGIEKLYKTGDDFAKESGTSQAEGIIGGIFGKTKDTKQRIALIEEAISKYEGLQDAQEELYVATENNSGAVRDYTDELGITEDKAEKVGEKVAEYTTILFRLNNALKEVKKQTVDVNALTKEQSGILEKVAKSQGIWAAEMSQFGTADYDAQINVLKNAITALVAEGLSPANSEIKRLRGELNALQSESLKAMGLSMETEFKDGAIADFNKEFNELRKNTSQLENSLLAETAGWDISDYMPEETSVDPVMEKMSRFKEIINEIGFSWENVGNQFTSTFSSMLSQGTLTFRGLAAEVGKLITRLLTQLALQVAIRAIFGDVSAGARAISSAGQVAGQIGMAMAGGRGIPMLANGGIATSPTLAMIGEGRESEAILPLSKLEGLMSGGYGGGQELVSRISGDDLLIMLRRASNSSNRNGSLRFSI